MNRCMDCVNFKALLSLLILLILTGCGGGGSSDGSSKSRNETSINSITINTSIATVKSGNTLQLTVTAHYSDLSSADVSNLIAWSSSAPNIANISTDGLIEALSVGQTEITALLDEYQDSITINIIDLIGISISPDVLTLPSGSTQQYTATGLYSDESTEDLSTLVSWDTDNNNISNSGLFTASTVGTNTISANLNGISGTASLVVSPPVLSSMTINSPTLLAKGMSEQLSVTGVFSDGSSQDISNLVTWSSNAPSTASINESNGTLTAKQIGNVIVTATVGNLSTTTNIEIGIATITGITITPSVISIAKGNSTTISVEAVYSDLSVINITNEVDWDNSNNSTATIIPNDANQIFTLIADNVGSASLTANFSGSAETLQLTVTDAILTNLSVSPANLSLPNGSIQQYIATGLYSDNNTQDLSDIVSWTTDNTNTISESGLFTATTVGVSSITATLEDQTSTASLTISSAELQRMTINAPASIAKGIIEQISATGIYSDGTSQDISNLVTWSSSDPSIANIDENSGVLTANLTGSTIITASINDLSFDINTTATVVISDATLTKIAVSPSVVSLAKGSTKNISIVAIFSDQSVVDISHEVIWENSNDDTVTIIPNSASQPNTLIAKNLGSATLTANFLSQIATLQVNVSNAVLTQLTVSPSNTSIPVGLSQRYTANGLYSDGTVQNLSNQVTWISDNEASATIDNITGLEGLAHSLAEGNIIISATLENISASSTLNVTNAQLNSIEIQPSKQTAAVNYTIPIKAIGHYTDGSEFEITNIVEWSASNQSILNISNSKNGSLYTQQEGDTLLNASLNESSGLAQIFVTTSTLQSIEINADTTTIPQTLQQQLQAIGTFSDGTSKNITEQVTWQSADTFLASIDNSFKPGLLQTNSAGQTSIKASLSNLESEIPITITNATINQIIISTPKSNLDLTSNTQALASAEFSDGSVMDISQWVNWSSSATEIASVNNSHASKGIISAHSAGDALISASLNNSISQSLPIVVLPNPNNPKAVSLSITPNVILNNSTDSAVLQAIVTPAGQDGEIIDGTAITFTITEGNNTRSINTTTIDGIASVSIISSYEGLISVTADIDEQDITSFAALYSTDNFSDVIGVSGQSNAALNDGNILEGSVFILFARNISNRNFIVNEAAIYTTINGMPALIERVEEPALLSDGVLSSGEFTLIGYELDEDLPIDNISISYSFEDETSGSDFFKGITFGL